MRIISTILRYGASRHFKKREYLKDKINELPTYRKIKNMTDLQTGKN
jgi:hypothetical protein